MLLQLALLWKYHRTEPTYVVCRRNKKRGKPDAVIENVTEEILFADAADGSKKQFRHIY
jgi:hypothetical protein